MPQHLWLILSIKSNEGPSDSCGLWISDFHHWRVSTTYSLSSEHSLSSQSRPSTADLRPLPPLSVCESQIASTRAPWPAFKIYGSMLPSSSPSARSSFSSAQRWFVCAFTREKPRELALDWTTALSQQLSWVSAGQTWHLAPTKRFILRDRFLCLGWQSPFSQVQNMPLPPWHETHFRIETSLKGLGYASSVGDAGRGHPDANVVSVISSIWLLTLIAIGWLARRAHSSACARLHQTELPLSLPTCVYKPRRASI